MRKIAMSIGWICQMFCVFIVSVLLSDPCFFFFLLCYSSDLCKSDGYNTVRKDEDIPKSDLQQSEALFEARYLD